MRKATLTPPFGKLITAGMAKLIYIAKKTIAKISTKIVKMQMINIGKKIEEEPVKKSITESTEGTSVYKNNAAKTIVAGMAAKKNSVSLTK